MPAIPGVAALGLEEWTAGLFANFQTIFDHLDEALMNADASDQELKVKVRIMIDASSLFNGLCTLHVNGDDICKPLLEQANKIISDAEQESFHLSQLLTFHQSSSLRSTLENALQDCDQPTERRRVERQQLALRHAHEALAHGTAFCERAKDVLMEHQVALDCLKRKLAKMETVVARIGDLGG